MHQKATLLPENLRDLYKKYKHSTPPTDNLLSLLETVLDLPGDDFLIVDALDECQEQQDGHEQLCKYLQRLAGLKRLHILVTSRRNLLDLEDGLHGSEGLEQISIHNTEVNKDIRLYVKSQLQADSKFRRMRWLRDVEAEIVARLSRDNGM